MPGKIVMYVEGATEAAVVKQPLQRYLKELYGTATAPRLVPIESGQAMIDTTRRVRLVQRSLTEPDTLGVILLLDVKGSPWRDAADLHSGLMEGIPARARVRAHAAQMEVEAWLLPFWEEIVQNLRRFNRRRINAPKPPPGPEEHVNHGNPPSVHLVRLFRDFGKQYSKVIDGPRLLAGTGDRVTEHLMVSARRCPQLMALLETLREFSTP